MDAPTPGGYFGRVLIVDLGDGRARSVPVEEQVLRSFIGGAGLGAWLMHRYGPPGVDALDPRAPLVFVFSPLVGTPLTKTAQSSNLVLPATLAFGCRPAQSLSR